jgi:hypothetical protein
MGRALNISRTGLMLETCHRIESEQVSLKSLDLDNKVIEITGRVIYSNQVAPDIHHIGISFLGSDDDMMDFSIRLLELSLSRRHNCYVKYAA